MPQELLSWWQNLNPQVRGYALDVAVVLGALLGGHVLGVLAGRFLRARRFNAIFRVTGPTPDQPQDDRGFTPTTLAGLLIRLTVWAAGAWWLVRGHGRPELAESMRRVAGQIWVVAAALTAALALAGLLARRVIECLEGVPTTTASRAGAAPPRVVAGAVGAGVYALVLLLTLLTVADNFDWPQTRLAAAGIWQLVLRLVTAGAAVLVGYLGARWAREFGAPQTASAETPPAQQTALSIVAATTALAVALLVFGAGLGVGVAILAVVAALLFLARGRLPDVVAGVKLRKDKVGTVWFEGTPWQVGQVGLLQSDVTRNGAFYRVANRQVLQASETTNHAPETNGRPALTR